MSVSKFSEIFVVTIVGIEGEGVEDKNVLHIVIGRAVVSDTSEAAGDES